MDTAKLSGKEMYTNPFERRVGSEEDVNYVVDCGVRLIIYT
jgi:hypothetical protein